MVDRAFECLWTLVSFLVHFFYFLRKVLTNLLLAESKAPRPDHSGPNGFLFKGGEPAGGTSAAEVDNGGGGGRGGEKVLGARPSKTKMKKRPARIVIPEFLAGSGFSEDEAGREKEVGEKEVEVEGSAYCLFSRRGKRHANMEDGYRVMTDINGDPKQAFFGVFDGHGGRAAVDFVSEKLGNNIVRKLAEVGGGEGEERVGTAIKQGYLTTDKEFLSKGMSSGACAATVLLKDGVLHVANAGDCRVVMSERGVAVPLTNDHCPGREDERIRIESSGGYVHCRNGVWRVQDSLAVSRSFGDSNLKEWIISEPETNRLPLTSGCQSLIIASDGLWDKVTDQEAVDVVSRHGSLMESCRDLVDISCSRGSRDDISVMVVDLQRFVQACG